MRKGCVSLDDWQAKARRFLPRFAYDFVAGGAEDGASIKRNQSALAAIELWPRVLRSTAALDTTTELFGRRWPLPLGIAPTGLNGLMRPDADVLLARAAAQKSTVFCLSTAANASMERVRSELPDLNLWLQLYVLADRKIAERMIARAYDSAVDALILTVDVPVGGKREADLRHGFSIPLRPSIRLALDIAGHPSWALAQAFAATLKMENLSPGGTASPSAQAALLSRGMDRSLDWQALDWIRAQWNKPLLLKGILHPADARLAMHHGVDGLIVSNHGGRQLDAAPATISALPLIVEAVNDAIPVLLDSGVRRGVDMARAMACGAKAVLIGRAPLYGLAADGQSGVNAVLELFQEEFERTLCLLGIDKARDLRGAATRPESQALAALG